MAIVQVHDKQFKTYISNEAIQQRVAALGQQISADYEGKNPLLIGILNGSFVFAADLFRNISTAAEISFIKLASYKGTSSTGNVITAIGMEESVTDRHVIIVEDIVDTGKTLHAFLPDIIQRQPASISIACFLSKPEALQYDISPKYVGFEIPNNFVVGYGLDYDGLGRNLPDLYTLVND